MASKQLISSLGNFSVQFNLQVASAAIVLLQTYRDAQVPKKATFQADFAEPAWASSTLKGIVFAGAFVGMIGMGFLGDLLGRRMGMMATLALVVVGALGSAVAPWLDQPGSPDPEMVYTWLTAFRFVLGAGVGGIYPMAAAMAAEAKAAVEDENGEDMEGLLRSSWAFFWQSVGACVPYLLALILIYAVPSSATQTSVQVTALFVLGALPAAAVLALTYYSTAGPAAGAEGEQGASVQLRKGQWTAVATSEAQPEAAAGKATSFWDTIAEHPEYLVSLIGTAGTWFIYDVAFYGINVFTPDILSAAFPGQTTTDLMWQSLVVSLCGVPACALAIFTFKRIGGRLLNVYGFFLNAAAFVLIGVLFAVYPPLPKGTPAPPPGLVAYSKFVCLCLLTFALNWGPNVATYVCPVQAFPPAVRGTFHGLSAAAGKLGAAVGAFLYPVMSAGVGAQGVAAVFFLQVAVNLGGALLAWYFIPARKLKGDEEDLHPAYSALN